MVKIGSEGTGGAQPTGPSNPLANIERDLGSGSTQPAISFFQWSLQITSGLTNEWFKDFPAVPGLSYLEQTKGTEARAKAEELFKPNQWLLNESVVHPDFHQASASLGSVVPLNQSSLAKKISSFLASKSVHGDLIPVTYSGGAVVEANSPMLWSGSWETQFGSRCFINYEVRRDVSGKEKALLFTNILINSRVTQDGITAVMSHFKIPNAIEKLYFLSETPFPSSKMSQSRSSAFSGVPLHLIPKPSWSIEHSSFGITHYDTSNGIHVDINIFPQVLRLGYVITEDMEEYFDSTISICVDALVKAATIIEDGFRNYRDVTKNPSFDHAFLSEYVLVSDTVEGEIANGWARWIPETHTSKLFYYGENLFENNKTRQSLQWIADEGIGSLQVGSAINDLVYFYLMPEGASELANFYLYQVMQFDVIYETTNAYTNSAQIFMKLKEYDTAISLLKKALAREDKFSETEASWLLAQIMTELGKPVEAKEFLLRGANGPDDEYSRNCREALGKLGL